MNTPYSDLFRVDPLTGCGNYLGFLEALRERCLTGLAGDRRSRAVLESYRVDPARVGAVLFADMNGLRALNETQGHSFGDSAIRWMGLLLQEESSGEVYRVGGDEFAVLLPPQSHNQHSEAVLRIQTRMLDEAGRMGFPGAAAALALLEVDPAPVSIAALLIKLGEAMARVKYSQHLNFMFFHTGEAIEPPGGPRNPDRHAAERWLILNNLHQVLVLGSILDDVQREAHTDPISGLPNLRAALLHMRQAVARSAAEGKPVSVLLVDGDNIRQYNTISYAAGDQLIRDMGAVLKNNLRPGDFVARWRTGDEFMIVLPDTDLEAARAVGERMRLAVKEASLAWRFPSSISAGAACSPQHGASVEALVDVVEAANKRAKDQGKDQVVAE